MAGPSSLPARLNAFNNMGRFPEHPLRVNRGSPKSLTCEWGYFPFFFSCLAFFFSLAVLVGFFLVSFLVSIDFAIRILLLLGFSISFFKLSLS
jgi:hypothetical protein